MDLLAKLEDKKNTFSKTEKSLKDYVLANLEDIENISIVNMSKITGASKSTISRFCRKLGYENFRAFSFAVAHQVAASYSLLQEGVSADDSTMGIAAKIFSKECSALEKTLNQLDPLQLDKLVNLILSKKKIQLFSVGGSSVVALDLLNKFSRLGIESIFQTDLVFQQISANNLKRNDIAWFLSFSGYDRDMIEMAEKAKKNQATIVCMTNNEESPLALLSDYTLIGSYLDIYAYTGTTESRLSLMYLADVLFTVLAVCGSPETISSLDETKETLLNRLNDV